MRNEVVIISRMKSLGEHAVELVLFVVLELGKVTINTAELITISNDTGEKSHT